MRHLINHVYGKEENSINLNLTQENARSMVATGPAQERAESAGSVWGRNGRRFLPVFIPMPGVMISPGVFQVSDAVLSLYVDGTSFI